MSQLAVFYLLDASKLPELQEHAWVEVAKKLFSKKYINHYHAYLENNAELLYGMGPDHWNAPPFICMTSWMVEEKGIDFFMGPYQAQAEALTEKSGTATFIWTKDHRDALRSKIDVESIPDSEMKRIGLEYYGVDSDEDIFPMRDAVRVMNEVLDRLEEGKVIVFLVS